MAGGNAAGFKREIQQAIAEGRAILAAASNENVVAAAAGSSFADDWDMVGLPRLTRTTVDKQRFLTWQATCRMILERRLPSVFPGRERLLAIISNASANPGGVETVLANLRALEAQGEFDNGASLP